MSEALKSFREDDLVKAVVLSVDLAKRKISFGIKPSYFNEEDFEMGEASGSEGEEEVEDGSEEGEGEDDEMEGEVDGEKEDDEGDEDSDVDSDDEITEVNFTCCFCCRRTDALLL